jgi:Cys-rich protein (TIGR01571 family)
MATVIGEDATGVDTSGQNIPIGKWRDGVFDCCNLGCGHAHFWLSWCCTPIALGQVMTRLHLDWLGSPMTNPSSWSTFKILTVSFIASLVLRYGMSIINMPYTSPSYADAYPYDGTVASKPNWLVALDGIHHCILYAYGLYLLIAMIRARSNLRSKYAIPEQYCSGCEDCCCSFWCHCCVVAQMARHLNDYEHNEASCCTDTGLRNSEPHII